MTTTLLEDALDDLFTIPDRFAEVPMLMALVPFVSVFPFVAGGRPQALPNLARQISHATFDAVDSDRFETAEDGARRGRRVGRGGRSVVAMV